MATSTPSSSQTSILTSGDGQGMLSWWKEHFWISLAVAMIVISVVLGLILCCTCRWHLRQGRKGKPDKSLNQNGDEEMTYENFHGQSPPLPPRDLPLPENASSQVTQSQLPPTHFLPPDIRKKVSIPSYTGSGDDYDDVEIPAALEKFHLKTKISSF